MKQKYITYNAPICVIKTGKFVHTTEPRQVRVMAVAEGYAMVRRKGCSPFAVPIKQLDFTIPPDNASGVGE